MASSINLINGGLDVQAIVDNLIAAERYPIDRLKQQSQSYQDKVSAYQALNTRLLAFQTSVESLLFHGTDVALSYPSDYANRLGTSLFAVRKATSSNEAVVSATAGTGVATGDFTVTVSRLAKFNSFASSNVASDTAALQAGGTLVVQRGAETLVSVTVGDTSNNTLQSIKNTINSANAGITATVVNDGSGTPYRLQITSNDSGAANQLAVTSTLAVAGGGAITFSETTPAEDAAVQINGIDITSASNSITTAVEGVTFSLKAESGTAIVSLARDIDAIVEGVKDLVAKYNDVISYISSQSKYDSTRKTAGILAGDYTLRQTQSRLSAVLFRSADFAGSSMNVLSQAGIQAARDGTLTLDESKLRQKLSGNFNDTAKLFLADGVDGAGQTVSLIPMLRSQLKTLTDSLDGPFTHVTDALRQNMRRIDDQVTQMEERLAARREILIAQYARADQALRQLSVLQASVTGLTSSLSNSKSSS